MTPAKTIPFLSLTAMLDDLNYKWHSPEYYIAPDKIINKPQFTDPFRPGFYGILLCVQGWIELIINDEPIRMDLFSFVAGGPNMIFQRKDQSSDCKIKTVYFTKEFLIHNLNNFNQFDSFHFFTTHFKDTVKLSKEEATSLIKLYDILMEKRDPGFAAYHVEIIRNLIFAYVYETAMIYHNNGKTIPAAFTKEVDISAKFQRLVTQNCTREHQLKFYADSLFITPKYLIHTIKKATGRTPGDIIAESIVLAAKVQLKIPNMSIKMIAESLRFSDLSSFSKFFKKHTGVSPLSFRKQAISN